MWRYLCSRHCRNRQAPTRLLGFALSEGYHVAPIALAGATLIFGNIRRLSLDALYSRRATRIDPRVILRTDYLLVLPTGVFSQKTMDAHY